jgi:hypothetical protein
MADGDDVNIIEITTLEEQKTEERRKPMIRERLALGMTAVVGLSMLASILATAISPNSGAVRDLIVPIMPELLVVYGMIIAFYFGQQHK